MQKDLGIIALVLAVIAIFTPFGTWLTLFVALIAAFAYGEGLWLSLASIGVNLANILWFSSRLWGTQQMGEFGAAGDLPFLPWILMVAQAVALMMVFLRHKKAQAKVTSNLTLRSK